MNGNCGMNEPGLIARLFRFVVDAELLATK